MRSGTSLLRAPAVAALCALALGACRRETSGQTAVLLALSTDGPVDCVVLSEAPAAAVDAGGDAAGTQTLQVGAGLPDEFRSAFRTARLTVLVYSGRALGEGAITLSADGFRGGCAGTPVARLAPLGATFTQGQVTPVEGRLALVGIDRDHDGWAEPEDCNDDDPTTYPGAPELCDGKDHSCSGVLDKGCACTGGARACYPLGLSSPTLGHGPCKAGTQACLSGKWDGFCAGAVVPAPEQCDDVDHDCDGQVGLPSCPCKPGDARRCYTKGPIALAGVGRCSWGQQTCGADGFFGPCTGDVGPLPEELCNGIDDNCDGSVDEELDTSGKPIMVRPACAKQEGVCAGSQRHCIAGAFAACGDTEYKASARAHGSTYGADANFCDGADHDCDGVIDTGCANRACPSAGATRDCYGPGLQSPTLQHAPCKKGTQTCARANGQLVWGTCAGDVVPVAETCNGIDDDCNGLVDDLPKGEGAACDTGRPGVCADGVRRCASGALGCQSLTAPSAEICDGLDNDCNGRTDELWNKLTDPAHCGGPNECRACPSGDACCGGRCADLPGDPLNCGACGRACAAGQGCCDGACVALDTGSDCGACGRACPAGLACRGGQCLPPTETNCANGVDDDGNGLTDCQDPACQGKVCDATGGTCNQQQCQHETSCADGLDNDGDGKIDCADPDCRGRRCANAGVCAADSRCVIELCNNGIDDNGDGLTDCQDALACPPPPAPAGARELCCGVRWTDVQSDVANCGACGTDCRAGHSSACGSIACVAGKCQYGPLPDRTACPSGVCCRGNCVADRESSCSNGIDDNCDGKIDCQDPLSCPPPGGLGTAACCAAGWTDLDRDPQNCGACGNACPLPPGSCAVATCAPGGACGTATDCNRPGCDGVACSAGGQPGYCSGGVCCAGCIASGGVCQPGTDLHACRSANGLCADCQPSNNPCVTDQCTAAGCTHTDNSNPCTTSSGQPGRCGGGACCAGCFDATGACQAIGAAHCGKLGGACLPQSCDDGDSCTLDVCNDGGSNPPFCTNPPQPPGTACATAAGVPGHCASGTGCCTGCLNGSACVDLASEDTSACGVSGAACAACPTPAECKQAACSAGACVTTDKPDGASCNAGAGTCYGGACVTCAAAALCSGVCCAPGETCSSSGGGVPHCACDTSGGSGSCASTGGCCSPASPSRCLAPSYDHCNACGKLLCSPGGDTGKCVDKNLTSCGANCGLGQAVACGGEECLHPGAAGNGPSGHLNVCSGPGNPQACNAINQCTCTPGDPSSCPGTSQVCRPQLFGGGTCAACGDFQTDGLACTGGLKCSAASRTCN